MADVKIIAARIVHETENGILIETQDAREIWPPLSAVSKIRRAERPELHVAEWLVRKEGL